jgi:hypothetical protein
MNLVKLNSKTKCMPFQPLIHTAADTDPAICFQDLALDVVVHYMAEDLKFIKKRCELKVGDPPSLPMPPMRTLTPYKSTPWGLVTADGIMLGEH